MRRMIFKQWYSILFTLLVVTVFLVGSVNASNSTVEGTIVNASTAEQELNFPMELSANTAYKITVSWDSAPVFYGNAAGYALYATSCQNDIDADALIMKAAKRADQSTDSSIPQFVCYFAPISDVSALKLKLLGLASDNRVSVSAEICAVEDNLIFDATLDIPKGTSYLNEYFDVNLEIGATYSVDVTWDGVPTYTAGNTAWKLQRTSSHNTDGDDAIIFKAFVREGKSDQSYTGTLVPENDLPVLNFFTQYVQDANSVRIIIRKTDASATDAPSPIGEDILVSAGNSSKYFEYDFKAGDAYDVDVEWKDDPVFNGVSSGWSLQTTSNVSGDTPEDLLIRTAKKDTDSSGKTIWKYSGTFIPTVDASYLNLLVCGLIDPSYVEVNIRSTVNEANLLLDTTLSVDDATEYISAFFDLNFENGKRYYISAAWDSAPVFTESNNNRTAWKVQATENDNIFGDDTVIYKSVASNQTAPQNYNGIYNCQTAKSVFNFFSQRIDGANEIHLRIEDSNPICDSVSVEEVCAIPLYVNGNYIQGFDIYKDVIFQCYDKGTCATYDLNTGRQIGTFTLGSGYASNHCGNANFGVEFPQDNTEFPALYVSGDLTTKACYVESVTTTHSDLIQTIYFDITPSYTGGQVIVDKVRNRLIYMQREIPSIYNAMNQYKITEFRIPLLSEGPEVHFTNDDIIGERYELGYYSPLYQGACAYQNSILQTHGYATNSFGVTVGIMNFDIATHKLSRYIDLTNLVPHEPQGITIYGNRLIVNFAANSGKLYEVKLEINIQTEGYQINNASTVDDVRASIISEVSKKLNDGFSVNSVTFPDDFAISTEAQVFAANVSIQTPWNCQSVCITGTVNGYVSSECS